MLSLDRGDCHLQKGVCRVEEGIESFLPDLENTCLYHLRHVERGLTTALTCAGGLLKVVLL